MKFFKILTLSILVIMAFSPLWGENQGAGTSEDPYILPEAPSAIKVDGVMEEKAWDTALKLDLPYETWPRENTPAQVKTEAYLCSSQSHLYVAFKCFEPKTKSIRAYYFERDNTLADDMVVLFLDTFNDERRAYGFRSNALGVQFDDIRTRTGTSLAWDAIYVTRTKFYDWGYLVEMAIPFNQLRIQKIKGGDEQVWGINVRRIWPRQYLFHLDHIKVSKNNNCLLCQFIKIKGFKGVTPSRNIELTPTLTAEKTDTRDPFPSGEMKKDVEEADAGLTARWGITNNLTMVGTFNPDFSQVEADSLKLDVNEPFALSYDERRPFFYEGAEYFQTNFSAVYTRMIRDPQWGFKLTGKAGGNTIGAYAVKDELTNIIIPGLYHSSRVSLVEDNISGVFRYKRDFGRNYTVGFLGTVREGDNDYHNRVFGGDVDFRFTRKDRLQAQFLTSNTQYSENIATQYGQDLGEFNGTAIDVKYTHDTRHWDFVAQYTSLSEDFRADLGYIPQVAYRKAEARTSYTWYNFKRKGWFRLLQVLGAYTYSENQDGGKLLEGPRVQVTYYGPGQVQVQLHGYLQKKVYNMIEFDYNRAAIYLLTKPRGNLEFQIFAQAGDTIDTYFARPADMVYLNPELIFKPNRHMRIKLNHTFQKVDVEAGHFYTANITNLSLLFHLNIKTYVRAILQYQHLDYNPATWLVPVYDESKNWNTQILLAYELNPRTVLYLGYSDTSTGTNLWELTQKNRTFFAKISYALSL